MNIEKIEGLDIEEIRDKLNDLIEEVKEIKEERDNFKEKLSNMFSNNSNNGWW